MLKKLLGWYNNNYELNVTIATLLFSLQIFHLVWLTTNVVFFKLFGFSWFPESFNWLVAVVDYTEIPALIGVSLVYVNELILGKATKKTWLYLLLLNSQWLHLFWITDEIVVEGLVGSIPIGMPLWLAWIAIFIDYLELPVMIDTIKRTMVLYTTNTPARE